MPDVTPFNLPFEEAIAFFAGKGLRLSPDSWKDVWQQAHARAFTVAGVTQMELLQDIRDSALKAISQGRSVEDFKNNLIPELRRKGWFAEKGEKAKIELPDGTIRKRLTAHRLETIWRTNMQTAYSVGRYKQMMETADRRPYWQYKAILDSVTRPAHAAMNNKVYDYRHPIWKQWYPPNGFHCRCYVKGLSARQVEQRGLEVETRGVDVQPDEGWRYNPGEAGQEAGWDKNARLPDCSMLDFADARGACVRIKPGQSNWRNQGRPDLREVPQGMRQPEPVLLDSAATFEDAIGLMRQTLDLTDQSYRLITTPIEQVIMVADHLPHMVERRLEARERYANYIIPTLAKPFEVYLTEYEDGLRERYIGLFAGKKDLMVIIRVNRDGSFFWNIMQAVDKDMNKHRVGTLLWPK